LLNEPNNQNKEGRAKVRNMILDKLKNLRKNDKKQSQTLNLEIKTNQYDEKENTDKMPC